MIKKEIRTTKIKDRVRAPKMQGNRVRKRKKRPSFSGYRCAESSRLKNRKKKKKKKKIGKKVKSKLIIKYNREKTSMQIIKFKE